MQYLPKANVNASILGNDTTGPALAGGSMNCMRYDVMMNEIIKSLIVYAYRSLSTL